MVSETYRHSIVSAVPTTGRVNFGFLIRMMPRTNEPTARNIPKITVDLQEVIWMRRVGNICNGDCIPYIKKLPMERPNLELCGSNWAYGTQFCAVTAWFLTLSAARIAAQPHAQPKRHPDTSRDDVITNAWIGMFGGKIILAIQTKNALIISNEERSILLVKVVTHALPRILRDALGRTSKTVSQLESQHRKRSFMLLGLRMFDIIHDQWESMNPMAFLLKGGEGFGPSLTFWDDRAECPSMEVDFFMKCILLKWGWEAGNVQNLGLLDVKVYLNVA